MGRCGDSPWMLGSSHLSPHCCFRGSLRHLLREDAEGRLEDWIANGAEEWNHIGSQEFAESSGIEGPHRQLVDQGAQLAQPVDGFLIIFANGAAGELVTKAV